jgi:hypothetical protein
MIPSRFRSLEPLRLAMWVGNQSVDQTPTIFQVAQHLLPKLVSVTRTLLLVES